MTTQPQSPSEQLDWEEIYDSFERMDSEEFINSMKALITQAADKREQAGRISELESLLLDHHGATVPIEPIQRRLDQLRQGRHDG